VPKILVVLTVALATLLTPVAAHAKVSAKAARACKGSHAVPGPGAAKVARKAVICLVNVERRRHGVRPLRPSRALTRAAQAHSADMARFGYFEHVDRAGRSAIDRVGRTRYVRGGWNRWAVGETIGWGVGRDGTPAGLVRQWMHSQVHRETMLDGRFREVGIGVIAAPPVPAPAPGATYTADFGIRA
jgi:uncharacterized protein YkwD